jgi:selenocysteine-specific elongation factor
MPLIGTAGHVDHGKSTLIERLTGRDPDRWAEEKQRGLTIDLGFAWSTLPSGTEVSFVDIPGHERFMRNALAGVDGFDAVLLVVAADEGWSDQTTEHVAALDALGIGRGVVAITKADLADADLVELATLDVLEHLESTSLAGLDAVAVSAKTGEGVDDLIRALDVAVTDLPDRDADPVRCWIDRVFSVAGAGTVVTGSLTAGTVSVGDLLEVMPGRKRVTVRGLHRHDQPVETASAGTRLAVNVTGVERTDLARGMVLTSPGTVADSTRLLVSLRSVAGGDWDRGAFHVHRGTGGWRADLRPIDDGHALLTTDDPLPAAAGDRFLLRDVGRRAVVAGGLVLDPAPAARRGRVLPTIGRLEPVAATADDRAAALLDVRGSADADDLARASGGGSVGSTVAAHVLADASRRLGDLVDDYHAQFPLRPGLPKAEAASTIGIGPDALRDTTGSAGVVEVGPYLARPEHHPSLTEDQSAAWETVRAELADAGNAPPRLSDLDLGDEVVHFLIREEELVDVGGFAYLPVTLDALVAGLSDLGDGWTVAEFRDHAGISRKYAVPLLEWLDARSITRRTGDTRSLR